MHNALSFLESDAFSSGQISSKLWLCRELEHLKFSDPQRIWIFGGWYGILSLLLLSREILPISFIRSFDINSKCESIADTILENWIWQNWKFKAITEDCNIINYKQHELPNIVINTSTEHFLSKNWFYNIPSDTITVLQSNNMDHDDHVSCFTTLEEFIDNYPMKSILFKGQYDFKYPTWSFSRYMIIGKSK